MSPEKLRDPEEIDLIERAVISLKSAIAGFHDFPNIDSLMITATQVWTDVNENVQLKKAIEEDIRQKRLALHQMGMLDISKGDPVRRRYDPYQWQSHIPGDYKNREGEYLVQRSESLIVFLEAFKSQE